MFRLSLDIPLDFYHGSRPLDVWTLIMDLGLGFFSISCWPWGFDLYSWSRPKLKQTLGLI